MCPYIILFVRAVRTVSSRGGARVYAYLPTYFSSITSFIRQVYNLHLQINANNLSTRIKHCILDNVFYAKTFNNNTKMVSRVVITYYHNIFYISIAQV